MHTGTHARRGSYLLDLVEAGDDAGAAVDVDKAMVLDVAADGGDPGGARSKGN